MQHTPGPWNTARFGYRWDVEGPSGQLVVTVNPEGIGMDLAQNNARLIAAAPDLLAAVRGLLICVEPRGDAEPLDAYETRTAMLKGQIAKARAAVTKATT